MKNKQEKLCQSDHRISVFIDVANVMFSMKNFDWYIDYKKLYDYFKDNYNLINVYFYTAIRKNNKKDKYFVNLLRRFGYIVKMRNLKIIKDKKYGEIKKGNMDGFIFVDVVDTIDEYDVCFLFSGDSDFEILIDYLHKKEKKMFVFSTKKNCSWELKEKADKYFSLQFFKEIANRKKIDL